jgi:hypothetical protein
MFLNVLVFSVLSATTAHLSEECPKYKTNLCLLINSIAKRLAAARWSAGPVTRLWIAAVLASALVELIAMAVEPAAAQSAAPVAKFETEPFSVWVVVDCQRECIRYFHATAGSRGSEAVVFIGPDLVAVNGRGEARRSCEVTTSYSRIWDERSRHRRPASVGRFGGARGAKRTSRSLTASSVMIRDAANSGTIEVQQAAKSCSPKSKPRRKSTGFVSSLIVFLRQTR